jgi:hypothetical protein
MLIFKIVRLQKSKISIRRKKIPKIFRPHKKIPQPYKTRTVLFKGEYQVSGIKIRKGIGKTTDNPWKPRSRKIYQDKEKSCKVKKNLTRSRKFYPSQEKYIKFKKKLS